MRADEWQTGRAYRAGTCRPDWDNKIHRKPKRQPLHHDSIHRERWIYYRSTRVYHRRWHQPDRSPQRRK